MIVPGTHPDPHEMAAKLGDSGGGTERANTGSAILTSSHPEWLVSEGGCGEAARDGRQGRVTQVPIGGETPLSYRNRFESTHPA